MGNCCALFKINKSKNNKNITVILTGLDNAGKTTMAKKLIGEPVDSVLQTLGFSLIKLRHHDYNVNLYDLGGSAQIREIWNKYYMDAHGVIYMVDASDVARLHESKVVFANLLSHENVSGKPVLVLANKQDKENALDELDIVDQLNVEYIVNKYRCPTRVELCSALGQNSIKIDPSIISGYKWLIHNIIDNYKAINDRVQVDMANYALLVQKDMDEWKKRKESTDDRIVEDEVSIKNGNPFKPIDSILKNGTSSKSILNSPDENITASSNHRKAPLKVMFNNQVTNLKATVRDQSRKLNQKFHRHKKKFVRFNKTAPMPIDSIIANGSHSDTKLNVSVSITSSATHKRPHNYLQSRPKTAPSTLHPIKYKEAAWDLSAPLDDFHSNTDVYTISKDLSDSQDVVSFF